MNFKKNFKRFFSLTRSAEGFTLVELIVVIAILAILAGVAVPAYSGYIKRANEAMDLQNISMLNNLFVVSCIANDVDPADVIKVTGDWEDEETKVFKGLLEVTRGGADDPVVIEFNRSMGGPITFKSEEISKEEILAGILDPSSVETSSSGNKTMSGAYNSLGDAFFSSVSEQIGSFMSSAFAGMGAENLLGQVADVASMAADLISKDSLLTAVVTNPEYINTLAGKLGMTSDQLWAKLGEMEQYDEENGTNTMAEYLANSTVLNVANTMNNMSAEKEAATKNNLAALNFADLGTTLNTNPEEGLAQAALLYGMYTAFDPEGAADLVDTADVSALLSLGSKTKTNADGTTTTFAEYIAQVNTSGSDAYNDYEGYKAALDIVNSAVETDKNTAAQAMTNGYSDKELQDLLNKIITENSGN